MEILNHKEGNKAEAAFAEDFEKAWIAAGKPESKYIDEMFNGVLDGGKCTNASLLPLWAFMTTAFNNNISINWFTTHRPPRPESLDAYIRRMKNECTTILDRSATIEHYLRESCAAMLKGHKKDRLMKEQIRLNKLYEDFFRVFVLCHCPSHDVTEDTIFSACLNDSAPKHPEAAGLWNFIRENRAAAPLHWFLDKQIRQVLAVIRNDPESWTSYLAAPWEANKVEALPFRRDALQFLQQIPNQPLPVRTKHAIRKDIGELFAGILEEERASRETTP